MNIEKLPTEPEKISCAAIVFRGETFKGATHVAAIDKLQEKYPEWAKESEDPPEGFMTTYGRFVDRGEAYSIARNNNQMKDKSSHPSSLTIEDLKD